MYLDYEALLIKCMNFGVKTLQLLVSTLVLKSRIHHFHALNWATPIMTELLADNYLVSTYPFRCLQPPHAI